MAIAICAVGLLAIGLYVGWIAGSAGKQRLQRQKREDMRQRRITEVLVERICEADHRGEPLAEIPLTLAELSQLVDEVRLVPPRPPRMARIGRANPAGPVKFCGIPIRVSNSNG